MFTIVSLYMPIYCLLFLALTFKVILARKTNQDKITLNRAVRAHGNFAEMTPLFLILLLVIEALWGSKLVLHVTASLFLVSRVMHAYSLIYYEVHNEDGSVKKLIVRQIAMVLTILSYLMAIGYLMLIRLL